MKALNLTMQAFGPYVDKVSVDFSKLNNKLFLISGPTGSGKTTILDGISFALFCKSTGARRSFIDMRNASVSEDKSTYVRFDFDLNNETYRFHREFKWIKNKKTGELKLKEEHSCLKFNSEEDSWDLLDSGSESKIRNKAQEILGLNSEQFSQVIVLPQGEFRKLLLSNSNDKLKIFQILFKTERFEKITKTAINLSSELKKQCEINLANYDMILKREKVESFEQLKQNYQLKQEDFEKSKKDVEELKNKLLNMNSALAEKQELSNLFNKRDELSNEISKLDSRKSEIETLNDKLRTLLSIREVYPSFNNYKNLKCEFNEYNANLNKAYEEFKLYYDQLLSAQKQQAEKNLLKSRHTNCLSEIDKLESAIEKLDQINNMTTQIKTLSLGLDELLLLKTHEEDNLKCMEINNRAILSKLEELKEIASSLADYKFKVNDLSNKNKSFSKLKDLRDELDYQQSQIDNANKELLEKQTLLNDSITTLEDIRNKQQNNIAAALASNLSSADPCPVCGSTCHPKLAKHEEHSDYNLKISGLESEIAICEQDLSKIKLSLAEHKASLDIKNQLLLEQQEICSHFNLGQDNINNELEKIKGEITEIHNKLNIKFSEDFCADEEHFNKLLEQLEDLENTNKQEESQISCNIDKSRGLINSYTEKIHSYELDLKTKQASCDTLIENLPAELKEYPSEDSFNKKLDELKQESLDLENNIKILEQDLICAQSDFNICKEQLKLLLKNYCCIIKNFYSSIEKLKLQSKNYSIDPMALCLNDDEFKKLNEDIDLIKEEISKYNLEKELILKEYNSVNEKLIGQVKPDISKLSEEISAMEGELNLKLQDSGRLNNELNNCKSSLDMLESVSEDGRELSDKYSKSARIANLLNGSNPCKVPFKIFALGLMLEDILNSSNIYFSNLTQNRYSFKHKSISASGRGFNGLDIEIFDAHFGSCRAVETLSGGEMFLASLALSFGLSDVVQNYSGGVHIDSIFIDEGFGSLDEETLNTALKALLMVQKSGRTIGIISHVEELKTFISNKIQINKLSDGQSTLRLIGNH